MSTKSVTIDIDIECEVCGRPLVADFWKLGGEIQVTPCETCLENAREEGKQEAEAASEGDDE